jgi:Mrp family chromosome partitioning ATPase
MTKIYEALENAGRGEGRAQAVPSSPALEVRLPGYLEKKLVSLCQRIEASLPAGPGKVVAFTGTEDNDSGSRVACQFAKLASVRMNKRVLLLASGPFSYAKRAFSLPQLRGWEYLLQEGVKTDEFYAILGSSQLAVSQLTLSDAALAAVQASPRLPEVMAELRERFDIIVVDAPSLGSSSDAVLLSPLADATVIVVEARKTRWQAVKSGMEQIEAQGGKVLGVILNKRRYYIPGFLYNRF